MFEGEPPRAGKGSALRAGAYHRWGGVTSGGLMAGPCEIWLIGAAIRAMDRSQVLRTRKSNPDGNGTPIAGGSRFFCGGAESEKAPGARTRSLHGSCDPPDAFLTGPPVSGPSHPEALANPCCHGSPKTPPQPPRPFPRWCARSETRHVRARPCAFGVPNRACTRPSRPQPPGGRCARPVSRDPVR